jgi:integrase
MSDEYRLGKHRGKYSLVYTDPERGRVRVALGTPDLGEAESRARAIWARRTAAPTDRVDDLWAAYVTNRKKHAVRKDRFDPLWKALGPFFGHKLGPAITAEDCEAYYKVRNREGMSDSTIKTELEFLRACLVHKYGKGKTPKLWLPPASKPRDRYLTKEEARELVDAIETPHVKLFVELALATGARMSAILDLTWDRVDLKRRTADFRPAGRHQTNKRRTIVPLNDRAFRAIEVAHKGALTDYVIEYAGQPVKSVKKAIRAAAARSGIPVSPHVFRHTAGVWMAEADLPMAKVAQYLGHTSSRITEQVYARYSPSFQRDSASALEF